MRTIPRVSLVCLLLLPGLARAQAARPIAGETDAGRVWSGTLSVEGAGPDRTLVARLELAGAGARTLRLAAPGDGPAGDVRVREREPGGGLTGALTGAPAAGTTFELERLLASSGFAVRVEEGTRGAWFRKVSSPAEARLRGIEARGRLPRPTFDPARWHEPQGDEPDWKRGPLDRPSLYLGGRAGGRELDCGLTWDRVFDTAGRPLFTDRAEGTDGRDPARRFALVSETPLAYEDGAGRRLEGEAARALRARLVPDFAFRPFWRTMDAAGNHWNQAAPGSADDLRLYPGERFLLRVVEAGRDRGRLEVRRLGADGPSLAVTFRQDGLGRGGPQSWKRVASIDQFREALEGGHRVRRGNEGRDVLATRTRVEGLVFHEVLLIAEGATRVPLMGPAMREVRGGDTAARYDRVFRRRAFTARGGETLDILPGS